MKNKSIAKNTIVYTIRIITSMIFPLITFPYISRILSPEGIGEYNFSSSVISYFSLLAGLGISTYAIREGAKVRDNKEKLEKLAQEMFTINIISTFVAYLLFIIVINVVPSFKDYRMILFILSLALPLSMLGTEWIFSIYEDYTYITIRSIAFQIISLILMFIFVKDKGDVNVYAIITVISNAGTNIFNFTYAKKYFRHKFVLSKNLIMHLQPIFILFASAIASQVYINLDTTMLGIVKGNYDVGLYSAATKIYNIVRSLLTAFITVITPRLTYYFSQRQKNNEYNKLLKSSLNGYAAIVFPAGIGIFCISRQALLLIAGQEYVQASLSLKILGIALIFSTLGSYVANEVLIISGQERKILLATITGATVNFLGNIILIPYLSYVGAALTTLIAEIIVFGMQIHFAKRYLRIVDYLDSLIKMMVSCVPMIIISSIIESYNFYYIVQILLIIIFAVFTYAIMMIIMHHEIVNIVVNYIKNRK